MSGYFVLVDYNEPKSMLVVVFGVVLLSLICGLFISVVDFV